MDIKDVEGLAELARLDLSSTEKEDLLKDLGSALTYVKIIEEAEVGDVVLEHEVYNVWREDKQKQPDFSKDLVVGQFPDSQDGFLKVKKIL